MSLETLQWVSPLVIVMSGVLFAGLEKIFPYNPNQKLFREGFWTDLIAYGILQSYFLALIIAQLIQWIDVQTGISKVGLIRSWPILWQVAFFIVTHDLNTYLIHRVQHVSRFLWRTHEAHHACRSVDFLSGIRSHSFEILMYQTVEFLPVVLLGASPEVPLYKGMVNAIYGMFIHANLNWKMGPLLWVLNGPELHRWHHAKEEVELFDKNLGTKFTVWDRIFGTFRMPKKTAKDYGAEDPLFPEGWLKQHLYAFRSFRQSSH